MTRDVMLGQDNIENIIFAFMFERTLKQITIFVKYSDEKNMELAKEIISFYAVLWKTGIEISDLEQTFREDSILTNAGVEFWSEITK